jgi:hypothetical protein
MVTMRERELRILFIIVALAVLATVLFVSITTDDLTPILLGFVIVLFIYAMSRRASSGGKV